METRTAVLGKRLRSQAFNEVEVIMEYEKKWALVKADRLVV